MKAKTVDLFEEDPDQTPEERLAWLRDHGIEVETPEDRRTKAKLAKGLASLKVGDNGTRSFTYVYIPADSSAPLAEIQGVCFADSRGDTLPLLLGPSFAAGKVDAEALARSAAGHLGNKAVSVAVTPDTIAASGGGVEKFRLAGGVSLYLDEVGALKKLPPNKRVRLTIDCCTPTVMND